MKFHIEGYGCSLNKADTQAIEAMLEEQGFQKTGLEKLGRKGIAIINACAVKETTEKRMLSRIEKLYAASKKQGFQLIVFGCLAKISSGKISRISESIVRLPPALESLSEFLSIGKQEFSPSKPAASEEGIISIIPICRGCLGNCSYCAVKHARGNLKSYSIQELKKAFEKEIKNGKKEVWLTAQDCGCYGFDLGTNLAELLEELLKTKGNYRIRVGMANAQHLQKFLPELLKQMKNERVFNFLHLPLQSGNDRILELMNRQYSVKEWLSTVQNARKEIPEITIATDIIVGFPTETEKEFEETLKALEKAKVDVMNISRYGKRPFTTAAKMKEVSTQVKKQRSIKATEFYNRLSLEENKRMLGKETIALIDEIGKKGNFIARSSNYKPIVLENAKIGEFVKVRVEKAEKSFLRGKISKIK
ncbi:MAG: tRNA (N(6)-L-threonylcarbamoyladenosine(37)-C(2))-methylthiotransferase [Candidatus Diapherotrites archaeon]|nr:tRNA (N(6)-L-threonylcarbamoyladenosine(37)-C(2))-methylthiotransferase [Candidatus Diapherotrites archaeon]